MEASEGRDRQALALALTALKSLGGTLRKYFDPASDAFTERVQRLLRHDGELATVIGP